MSTRLPCSRRVAIGATLLLLLVGATVTVLLVTRAASPTTTTAGLTAAQIAQRIFTGQEQYRLADVVQHSFDSNFLQVQPGGAKVLTDHAANFHGSFAAAFLASGNSSESGSSHHTGGELHALQLAADEMHARTCAVHLRVGDVLDPSAWRRQHHEDRDLATILRDGYFLGHSGVKSVYGLPLSYYRQHAATMREHGVQTVVVVAGSHEWLPSYALSAAYIEAVGGLFTELGFQVRLRLGQHPDEDFLYFTSARCFVQGGGGFSRLAERVVRADRSRKPLPCHHAEI